jgi:EpsI family protein
LPRAKYKGKAVTAEILDSIPMDSGKWQGKDIKDIGDNLEGEVYNFISRVFARQYAHKDNPEQFVFLVVLDAGNFHYPKVCFKGAGFETEELPPGELKLEQNSIKVHLMLSKKKNEQLLSIYWICIDKEIVPTWARQKVKQLYYSLFNKERVGLMMRVDIPVTENVDDSLKTAEIFLNELYEAAPRRYRGYIFSDFGG